MGILKNQLETSKLGLNGKTPEKRAGALETSTLHAPIEAQHSKFDLNGNMPQKYLDIKPE